MSRKTTNNIIIISIVIVLFSLINTFIFVHPYINYKSEKYAYEDFYKNFNVDFDIPSPSKHQVNELRKLDFIERVIPYYYSSLNIDYGKSGKNRKSNVLFFENIDDLSYIYNDNRLINRLKKENGIYIDYSFVKDSKVKENDILSISINGNKNEYLISGVYKENIYYNNGAVALIWQDSFLNRNIEYSGAYIKAKDKNKLKSYLMNYKPYGKLKTRDNFENDESYKIHLNAIESGNYLTEITDIEAKSKNEINRIEINSMSNLLKYIIGFILLYSILFISNYILLLKDKPFIENKIVDGIDENILKGFYFKIFTASIFVAIIFNFFMAKILKNTNYYIPSYNLLLNLYSGTIASIIAIIISYIINKKNISYMIKSFKIKRNMEVCKNCKYFNDCKFEYVNDCEYEECLLKNNK